MARGRYSIASVQWDLVPLVGGDVNVPQARHYLGFSLRNNGSGNALLRIFRGAGPGGPSNLLDVVALAAGESARAFYWPAVDLGGRGLYYDFISAVAGDVEGNLRILV